MRRMFRNVLARARALKAAADYKTQRALYVDPDRGFVRTAITGERDGLAGRAIRVGPRPSALQRIGGLVRRLASSVIHGLMDLFGLLVEAKATLGGKPAPEGVVHVVGHRGSPSKKVENTIESFEEAVLVDGADVVETDLCVTKDGEVVCWHD